jgi:hypothetical protein
MRVCEIVKGGGEKGGLKNWNKVEYALVMDMAPKISYLPPPSAFSEDERRTNHVRRMKQDGE